MFLLISIIGLTICCSTNKNNFNKSSNNNLIEKSRRVGITDEDKFEENKSIKKKRDQGHTNTLPSKINKKKSKNTNINIEKINQLENSTSGNLEHVRDNMVYNRDLKTEQKNYIKKNIRDNSRKIKSEYKTINIDIYNSKNREPKSLNLQNCINIENIQKSSNSENINKLENNTGGTVSILEKRNEIFQGSKELMFFPPSHLINNKNSYRNLLQYMEISTLDTDIENSLNIGENTYYIEKKIGMGAKANIYLIRNEKDQKFALKVNKKKNNKEIKAEKDMHKMLLAYSSTKDFTIEAEILYLKNNNKTRDYEYYIILKEYIDGRTLKTIIEENDLDSLIYSLKQFINLLIKISNKKLVIKDLHVANIMLPNKKDSKIKIIDGALVNKIKNSTLTSNVNFVCKKWPWKSKKYNELLRNELKNKNYKNIITEKKYLRKKPSNKRASAALKFTPFLRESSIIKENKKPGAWMPNKVTKEAEIILRVYKTILNSIIVGKFGEFGEYLPTDLFDNFLERVRIKENIN